MAKRRPVEEPPDHVENPPDHVENPPDHVENPPDQEPTEPEVEQPEVDRENLPVALVTPPVTGCAHCAAAKADKLRVKK